MESEALGKMTLVALRQLAKEHGVSAAYQYKKGELLTKLGDLIREESQKSADIAEPDESAQPATFEPENAGQAEDKDTGILASDSSSVSARIASRQERGTNMYNKEEYEKIIRDQSSETAVGVLEILPDGFGFLRGENYLSTEEDVYISPTQIRRFRMKTGDKICGIIRPPKNNEKFHAILYVKDINGIKPVLAAQRKDFDKLVPVYPSEKLVLETNGSSFVRILDLVAPLGKGQRGLIVSPPKTGKTMLLKAIAKGIEDNYPDVELMILLVDERPEEVTDIREAVQADVISSTFDELPAHHIKVAEMVLDRARNLVEHGKDVVVLLDSITRLARAYNMEVQPSGRTLSGGLDPGALYGPKKFFGAARNVRGEGSLTILATALVDTGSRMDDVIFEEFKGTGNMEIFLDRKLAERRIYPAIDLYKSGTRKEEMLLSEEELVAISKLRRALGGGSTIEITETVLNLLKNTKNNRELVGAINKQMSEK